MKNQITFLTWLFAATAVVMALLGFRVREHTAFIERMQIEIELIQRTVKNIDIGPIRRDETILVRNSFGQRLVCERLDRNEP